MMQRAAVPVVVYALSAAVGAQGAELESEAPKIPAPGTRGLNVLVSGMFAQERQRMTYGFLLGGAIEVPVAYGMDLNIGMSFQRLASLDGPITVLNVIEATLAKHAEHSVFFGAGLGPMFALGAVRPAAKVFVGAELFHLGVMPVQVAVELIMKFCEDDASLKCAPGEKQTWLAGRLGFRL